MLLFIITSEQIAQTQKIFIMYKANGINKKTSWGTYGFNCCND